MTVTIDLTKEAESRLKLRASEMGKEFPEFVEYLVEREALDPDPSFAEIVAPVHEDFRKSGMTEGELEDFIDDLVQEVRQERRLRAK